MEGIEEGGGERGEEREGGEGLKEWPNGGARGGGANLPDGQGCFWENVAFCWDSESTMSKTAVRWGHLEKNTMKR